MWQYLRYRVLALLVGILPESAAVHAGYSIGYLLSFVAREKFHIAKQRMQEVLGRDVPQKQVRKATRRMLGFWGRYWAEIFWIRSQRLEKMLARIQVEGIENLLSAQNTKKGIIVISAHIGNVEVAGAWYAARYGKKLLVVTENLENPRILKWSTKRRRAMNIEVLVAGTQNTPRQIREHLRKEGVVVLLNDRIFPSIKGISTSFFGQEIEMPRGPATLALTSNAPLLPVAVYFEKNGHRIVISPPLSIPQAPTREERITEGAQQVASALEKMIRRVPEQWLIAPTTVPFSNLRR
ncbi:MAG: hypothetical protein AAB567_02640 [Patescibacteria group bacterium]